MLELVMLKWIDLIDDNLIENDVEIGLDERKDEYCFVHQYHRLPLMQNQKSEIMIVAAFLLMNNWYSLML